MGVSTQLPILLFTSIYVKVLHILSWFVVATHPRPAIFTTNPNSVAFNIFGPFFYIYWFLCFAMIGSLQTGVFGYIAFYDTEIVGDILLSLPPSFTADMLKFGFVISVALSFPLMVFPCRQSLNTLLFSTVSRRVAYDYSNTCTSTCDMILLV